MVKGGCNVGRFARRGAPDQARMRQSYGRDTDEVLHPEEDASERPTKLGTQHRQQPTSEQLH